MLKHKDKKKKNNAESRKNTALALELLRYIAMVLILVWFLFKAAGNFSIFLYGTTAQKIGFVIFLAIFAVVEAVLHALKEPIWRMLADARNEIEFDENGLYRAKNEIQKLSRPEREELGKRQLAEVERILGTGTLQKITKEGSTTPNKDLKAMQGLLPIKKKVKEITARMEFDRVNKNQIDSTYHMCFYGSPGTGKTTVVKILTGILYKNNIIKKNEYIETDGNFLRGDTAKETNEKINLLVRFAKGKVLFIDEAYSMFSGDAGTSQDVIATLIKLMEDNRKDFVLIVAGYKDEMKRLIEANPGFKSRISIYLDFPDYSNRELVDIFSSMANANNFYVPEETRERLEKRFDNERRQRYFGNARTARNVLDESISRHALNLKEHKIKKDDTFKIMPIDVSVTVSSY